MNIGTTNNPTPVVGTTPATPATPVTPATPAVREFDEEDLALANRTNVEAGTWKLKLTSPVTIVDVANPQKPLARSKSGELTYDTKADVTYGISWSNGQKYSRVRAVAPAVTSPPSKPEQQPPAPGVRVRPTLFGVNFHCESNKRTELVARFAASADVICIVSSDWRDGRPSFDYSSEVEMVTWVKSVNPTGDIVYRDLNGWPQEERGWSDADYVRHGQAVGQLIAPHVKYIVVRMEPNNREFYADAPKSSTPEWRAELNRTANIVAREIRKACPTAIVATPAWINPDHVREAIQQCPDCNAVAAHPYNWTPQQLDAMHAHVGDRPLVYCEWGSQRVQNTPAEQAEQNERIRRSHVGKCDVSMVWTLQIPRIKTGPKKGQLEVNAEFMAAFTSEGQPRGPLATWVETMIVPKRSPEQRRTQRAFNVMRAAAGLPPCRWDASLAAIARAALDRPGDLSVHPPEAGGRGVGAFGGSLDQSIDMMRSGTSRETVIGRGKVLDRAHTRMGVELGDGGFYAVFGV
jgi:hypothetical protein